MHRTPPAKLPTMVLALAGWPDAAESATTVVKYLVRKLKATKFADIDPDEFYEFSLNRPQTKINARGEREIVWQANNFYFYSPEDESQGLLLYSGTEPNLKWRSYCKLVLDMAESCGVQRVISLGALLDAVPHTREVRITGRANEPSLARKLEDMGVRESGYQGPCGITTALMDAAGTRGMAMGSLCAHNPHYVTSAPNPKASYALLTRLLETVTIDVDPADMRASASTYEVDVNKAISAKADVHDYVRRLERSFDVLYPREADLPNASVVVEEIEEFLKKRNPPNPGG